MDEKKRNSLVAEMRREQEKRLTDYRERALKLFPHVCGRCGRDFEGKKLRELTVHHRDHNHDNNPADGSNWELLCIYCHDHEHTRSIQQQRETGSEQEQADALRHSPFAALAGKVKSSDS